MGATGNVGKDSRKSRGGNRPQKTSRLTVEAAKVRALECISQGMTVNSAMEKVDRSIKTWEYWRRHDKDFAAKVDTIMSTRGTKNSTREENRAEARRMGFAAWRWKYLKTPTYWHQHQWIDLIEGREPRDLHDAQTFKQGRRGRLLINTPPNHSKTTTITVDYATYRICCDPQVRIAMVSETEGMAKKFLAEVKDKLTLPKYADLIRDFAPEGGYKTTAEIWGATQIKIADRDSASKDPTCEALGIGGQIYGARLDLIFIDDAINKGNASQWEAQMEWLRREVASRPGPAGRIIVVGTRIASFDLYGQLMDRNNYNGKDSPWTYLSQPAVLEPASEDDPGKTLWPYASMPWVTEDDLDVCELCDGSCHEPIGYDEYGAIYPRWDMVHLLNGPREENDEKSWQIIYQQKAIPEDSAFPEFAVKASVNNRRRYGKDGGLDSVPEDAYYIGSMDPATSGNAFALVLAVSRSTKKRYVVDAVNLKAPTPARMKALIREWSTLYPIREWRVEKTGLLTMFTQDQDLRTWVTARGIRFTQHYTGSNKWDSSFGVASMSSLFGAYDRTAEGILKEIHPPLIEFPRLDTPGLKLLVDQLIVWTPDLDPKKVPCDGVMALWFAEIAARDIVKAGDQGSSSFQKSKYLSPRQRQAQKVINLADYRFGAAV